MLEQINGMHSPAVETALQDALTVKVPNLAELCSSVWRGFERLVRVAAGTACLMVGAALTLTFWLLPLGIPVALFGTALLCSGSASVSRTASC